MARPETSRTRSRRGAYGLRIDAPGDVDRLLVPAEPAWPHLAISTRVGAIGGRREIVDRERATLPLIGAVAEVDRGAGTAEFIFEASVSVDAVVHPYLAPIAGLFAHWYGRDSLHAGAFVAGGGAWGVVSAREGGKSSTLARLALHDVPIVSDDMLVVEDEAVFAGPRAIDLRAEPARALGVGEPLGVLGSRERWRVQLDQIEPVWPLRGWVFLTWGDAVSVTKVGAGDRLVRLAAERTIRLVPQSTTALLRLAALPSFEVQRPRHWKSLEEATARLLEVVS